MSMISARIERLPFARFHKHLLLMGGLGYMFDAMDAAVLAFILPVLRVEWGLTSDAIGLLGSSTFIGFFFGALLAGTLGDLIGRRADDVGAGAAAWPRWSAPGSTAGRRSSRRGDRRHGHGRGKRHHRAPSGGVRGAALSRQLHRRAGGLLLVRFRGAALLGYFIVPAHASGWRIVLVITALPVVMLLWWRRALPESPRWQSRAGPPRPRRCWTASKPISTGGATLAEPRPEASAAARPASGPIRAAAAGPADAHHADDLDHVAVDHLQLLLVLRVDPGPAGRAAA